MDQLREALEHARTGHGQVVAVVGEPGVGKSRLYWEFTRSHRTQGWLIAESSSVSYGKATAFLPIIDLLRAYFQIEAGDEARRIREKVTGKLLSLDRVLEPSLPALLWLLDVPVEDPQWQRLDAPQRRQQALEGVKRLLLRESQVQPVLVLFEDLHWIDAETQALLDGLVESLPTARLLLLVNYRPEYRHGWSGKTYYRQLRIDPLPPESAEELLAALLGNDSGLQPLKRLLIERTDRKPLLSRGERPNAGGNEGAGGGARSLPPGRRRPEPSRSPRPSQAILAARIDRLSLRTNGCCRPPPSSERTCRSRCSRPLRSCPRRVSGGAWPISRPPSSSTRRRLFPDLEYTFKHALTHDVAYGELAPRPAAQSPRPDRGRDRASLPRPPYATTWTSWPITPLRAKCGRRRSTYLRQAGAKAFARSANREALGYFEQALTALTHLPRLARRWSRPSTSASTSETRSTRSANSRPASKVSPGRPSSGRAT